MMRKRCLALALCLVMALALFVPAQAAVPMGGADTVSASHSDAVADTPAVLAAVCTCSASNPHANGDQLSYPSGGTVHYLPAGQGSKFAFQLVLEAGHTYTTPQKNSNLSNNGSGEVGSATYYGFKTNSGSTDGASATLTFKMDEADQTITIHFVDPDAHHHAYNDGAITEPATCGEDGVRTYTCTASGCSNPPHSYTEAIPATGAHNFTGEYSTIKPATCKDPGVQARTCAVCGQVSSTTEVIPKNDDHTYPAGSTVCSVCDYDSATGQTHTHAYGDWSPKEAATCLKPGAEERTCASCGKVETQAISRLAHSFTGAGGVCVNGCGQTQAELAGGMDKEGGEMECAFVEWTISNGAQKYEVFIKPADAADSAYEKLDDELIRRYPNNIMRADALGLAAGVYKMKVVPDKNEALAITSGNLTVTNYPRVGYAFYHAAQGHVPGAYKMDGTLKDNARVLYVTDANKDTVELEVNNKGTLTNCVGIQNIMYAYQGGAETRPLAIRFIGKVSTPSVLQNDALELKLDKDQSKTDPGTSANITFEGVGFDATLHGFGITITKSSDVEIRNLAVMDGKADSGDSIGVQSLSWYIWVHDMDFFYGIQGSGDHKKGDGSMDAKDTYYTTQASNHFWDNGKAMLSGMKTGQDWYTIAYNWFDHSDSRHPRVRTATTHVVNNFYDNVDKYGIGATYGCSIFAENNYFLNVSKPMLSSKQGNDGKGSGSFSGEDGGIIKAYGNTYAGTSKSPITYAAVGNDSDCYEAANRGETVPSGVKTIAGQTGYSNFDTASDFYEYDVMPADDTLLDYIRKYAGRLQGGDMRWDFTEEDSKAGQNDGKGGWPYDGSPNPQLKAALLNYETDLIAIGGDVSKSTDKPDPNFETPPAPEPDTPVIDPDVTVSAVTLNKTALTLEVDATETLTATVTATPDTAANKAVTWKSSNSAVASVDQTGKVTAHKAGSATITATSAKNSTVKATCAVTVNGGGGTGPSDPGAKTYVLTGDGVFSGLTSNGTDDSSRPLYNCTAFEVFQNQGTDGYFTIYAGGNKSDGTTGTKIDYSKKTIGTGANSYTGTYRINFTGKMAVESTGGSIKPANAIAFTTTGPATVKVWWGGSSDDANGRYMAIQNASGAEVAKSTEKATSKNDLLYSEMELTAAGTYYLGGSPNKSNIFKVEVAVTEISTEPDATGILDGADTDLHYEVTAGAVTITDPIPSGHKVLVGYWDGAKFLGVRLAASNAAVQPLSGWTDIKLIWLGQQYAPQSPAETISAQP